MSRWSWIAPLASTLASPLLGFAAGLFAVFNGERFSIVVPLTCACAAGLTYALGDARVSRSERLMLTIFSAVLALAAAGIAVVMVLGATVS